MKFYIATKTANSTDHNRLRDLLEAAGHTLTCDWTLYGEAQVKEKPGRRRELAEMLVEGVKKADVLILLWPGGRGAHAELGAALAYNKPVLLCGTGDEEQVWGEATCLFYHHPQVTIFERITDLVTHFLLLGQD